MTSKRIPRLNSLLKEVISEVVHQDVSNPKVSEFITITRVDVSKDLHSARVYFSVIGDDSQKKDTLDALSSAAGYVGVLASKKVVLRHFPELRFFIDDSVDDHIRIEQILRDIQEEKEARPDNE